MTLELSEYEFDNLRFALINDINRMKNTGVREIDINDAKKLLEKMNEVYYHEVLVPMKKERENEITPIGY